MLLIGYGAGLVFSLKTHRRIFNPEPGDLEAIGESWSVKKSVIALAIAGIAVAAMSEILVGVIEETAQTLDVSEFFIA